MAFKGKNTKTNNRNTNIKFDADGLIRDIDSLLRLRDKGLPLSLYQIDILKDAGLWNQETYKPRYNLNY